MFNFLKGFFKGTGTDGWVNSARPMATLTAVHFRLNPKTGTSEPVAKRVAHGQVTDVGVRLLVDALQSSGTAAAAIALFKYHDSGTAGTGEGTADTQILGTTGMARVAGTQAEGTASNVYSTVATIPYTGSFAVAEHGIFHATSGATLLDRTVFGTLNVGSADSIQFTYQLTTPSGG
ncbi:MAG: hypothetical protein Q8O40_16320 [Chloroflexota bacterium]|nr:hypothetical protein [Chloroflexota bacterium]